MAEPLHPKDPDGAEGMTPQQAASALRDLEGFEDGLTARVGGLTCMVWGIVSPAIFITYGLAARDGGYGWLTAFLWAPWTLLGVGVTSLLWRLHAITLRRDPAARAQRGAWFGVSIMLFFLASILLLHFVGGHLHALAHPLGWFHYMLVINGLAAGLIVLLSSRRRGRLTALPLVFAGVLMVVAGFLLGHLDLSVAQQAFFCAGVVALGYGGAGLVSFLRG